MIFTDNMLLLTAIKFTLIPLFFNTMRAMIICVWPKQADCTLILLLFVQACNFQTWAIMQQLMSRPNHEYQSLVGDNHLARSEVRSGSIAMVAPTHGNNWINDSKSVPYSAILLVICVWLHSHVAAAQSTTMLHVEHARSHKPTSSVSIFFLSIRENLECQVETLRGRCTKNHGRSLICGWEHESSDHLPFFPSIGTPMLLPSGLAWAGSHIWRPSSRVVSVFSLPTLVGVTTIIQKVTKKKAVLLLHFNVRNAHCTTKRIARSLISWCLCSHRQSSFLPGRLQRRYAYSFHSSFLTKRTDLGTFIFVGGGGGGAICILVAGR